MSDVLVQSDPLYGYRTRAGAVLAPAPGRALRASQHARSLDPERRREADGWNTRTMSDSPLHLSIEALPAAAQGMAPLRRRLAVPRECGYISSSVPCDDDRAVTEAVDMALSGVEAVVVWARRVVTLAVAQVKA